MYFSLAYSAMCYIVQQSQSECTTLTKPRGHFFNHRCGRERRVKYGSHSCTLMYPSHVHLYFIDVGSKRQWSNPLSVKLPICIAIDRFFQGLYGRVNAWQEQMRKKAGQKKGEKSNQSGGKEEEGVKRAENGWTKGQQNDPGIWIWIGVSFTMILVNLWRRLGEKFGSKIIQCPLSYFLLTKPWTLLENHPMEGCELIQSSDKSKQNSEAARVRPQRQLHLFLPRQQTNYPNAAIKSEPPLIRTRSAK